MTPTYSPDPVALVTGAASGIGLATATMLLQEGYRVALVDRDLDAAPLRAAESDLDPDRTILVGCDVSDSAACDAAVERTVDWTGRLDVLVSSAGISPVFTMLDATDDQWRSVIDVNLTGMFYICRAAARQMATRGEGNIVLLASDAGVHGAKKLPAYSSSKGGVIAFMRSVAQELGPLGIRVNAVNPGVTATPMTRASLTRDEWAAMASSDPLGELGTPEDVAEVIRFLVGPAHPFMTGQLVTTRMRALLPVRDPAE